MIIHEHPLIFIELPPLPVSWSPKNHDSLVAIVKLNNANSFMVRFPNIVITFHENQGVRYQKTG